MVKRWQHTRGSNSMRAGDRGEAKSRRHVARRSHGDVVRVGHGFTGQLTLGRSPDCLVAGRRADTRGSNSRRAGDRGEAISRRHVARRSHGDVVRVGHGCTSQLTLGRSPDCLVAGRRADLSEGVGKQQVAVLVDGHSVGLPFRLNRRSRALAIDRAACPSSALWAPSPRGGRIRWLSIRWGRPNVGSYASVYAIGQRPPSPARAAVSNIQDHIAGAGDGSMANWGVRVVSGASNPI